MRELVALRASSGESPETTNTGESSALLRGKSAFTTMSEVIRPPGAQIGCVDAGWLEK